MSVESPKWKLQRGGIFHRKPFCEHSAKDAKYLARSAKIAERIAGDISSIEDDTERKDKWISYSLGLANTLASKRARDDTKSIKAEYERVLNGLFPHVVIVTELIVDDGRIRVEGS
jgi:radical SAM superfamily enzyme